MMPFAHKIQNKMTEFHQIILHTCFVFVSFDAKLTFIYDSTHNKSI